MEKSEIFKSVNLTGAFIGIFVSMLLLFDIVKENDSIAIVIMIASIHILMIHYLQREFQLIKQKLNKREK